MDQLPRNTFSNSLQLQTQGWFWCLSQQSHQSVVVEVDSTDLSGDGNPGGSGGGAGGDAGDPGGGGAKQQIKEIVVDITPTPGRW